MNGTYSVRDLQRQPAKLIREANSQAEPIAITQRGQISAVLHSVDLYEQIEKDLIRLKELKSKLRIDPTSPTH